MSTPTPPHTVRSRIPMPEHTARTDRTAGTVILSAGTPAQDGKRAVTAEPAPKSTRSFRHLAAGDYWFDNNTMQSGEGPDSRPHT
ncbi:hypothetical protein B1K54_35395 [Streptomyces sp. fd1-xmd]|nr:hypothetical protein B1K54_35395 [Streptomyces sp. fd1-xmd]